MKYEYKATIIKIVDGDTVDAVIRLGLNITVEHRLRLYGINTYEINSSVITERELAKQAREYLIDRVLGKKVLLETFKPDFSIDKYGRYLAKINLDGADINYELVELGLAVPYMV